MVTKADEEKIKEAISGEEVEIEIEEKEVKKKEEILLIELIPQTTMMILIHKLEKNHLPFLSFQDYLIPGIKLLTA